MGFTYEGMMDAIVRKKPGWLAGTVARVRVCLRNLTVAHENIGDGAGRVMLSREDATALMSETMVSEMTIEETDHPIYSAISGADSISFASSKDCDVKMTLKFNNVWPIN